MHAKWNPVCIAVFQVEPEIILTPEVQNLELSQKEAIVASCPTGVFGINAHTSTLEVRDHMKCMFCEECVYKCTEDYQKPNIIKIENKKDKFLFRVETTGVLRPVEVMKRAFDALRGKLDFMKKEIEPLTH